MLWLIDYENAHWCGGQLNVVVHADSEQDALDKAEYHMEETQRELFSDEFEEADGEYDDECAYSVNSVEVFDENHEQWQYFQDPAQREAFYPEIF